VGFLAAGLRVTAADALVGVVLALASLSLPFNGDAAGAAVVTLLMQAFAAAFGDGPRIDLLTLGRTKNDVRKVRGGRVLIVIR
jgi:hypothetical protein